MSIHNTLMERLGTVPIDRDAEEICAAARRLERFYQDGGLAACDSPVEQRFVASFIARGWSVLNVAWVRRSTHEMADRYLTENKGSCRFGFAMGQCLLLLQPFASVTGQPRLDFAFLMPGLALNVETDGHEFHERTKEQAARDKSRDRLLVAAGWRVLRFTGSEIVRDAGKCAGEVEAILIAEAFSPTRDR